LKAIRNALALLLALLAAQAPGQVAGEPGSPDAHRYELPNQNSLELAVPAAWDDSVDQPEDGGPPTIELRPRDGAPFEVYLTPNWPEAPNGTAPDAGTLRETVLAAAERIRGQTVEQTLEIRRLQGANGVGFYFFATDRAPQPEEFRFMNQGALQVGDLTVMFTILTNDGQETVVEEAFAMLSSAVYRDTGGDQQ
jgi:hypothetical protein